jgi:hypothetical protein
MAAPNLFIKHPLEVLAYNVDFNPWLTGVTDTALSFTITVGPGLTQPYAATLSSGVVTFWLSGGTDQVKYSVVILLTTTGNRVKEETIYIKVQE